MNTNRTIRANLLIVALALFCGILNARDGVLFNDVAPISIKFDSSNYTGQYISFLNTSDEIIHDITLSNKVDGNRVSVVVISTIQSHKSTIFHGNALIKALKKLGLKDDGSGVIGSGMTITCKYHSKPTPVIGWWESNFNKWLKYELTSKKTGRKYVVEFEKEPTNEDIDHALERLDSESAR